MTRILFILWLSLTVVTKVTAQVWQYVDPRIGSIGVGRTFPGPCMPFGMVKPGPDCGVMPNAGWAPMPEPVSGFSQTHVSGTGGGQKYGNILIQPFLGHGFTRLESHDYARLDTSIGHGFTRLDTEGESHGYTWLDTVVAQRRVNETISLGYYATTYESGIRTEITTNERCAHYRLHYPHSPLPHSSLPSLFIDATHFLGKDSIPNLRERQQLVGAEVEVVNNHEVQGYSRIRGGWNNGDAYTVYFCLQTDKPFMATNPQHPTQSCILTFTDTLVCVKVGISYVSTMQARRNIDNYGFDQQLANLRNAWQQQLQKIQIEGDDRQKRMFYTALYHTMLMPVCKTGENPKWTESPYYDDYYAIWDTYRTSSPLLTLLWPERQVEIVNSLLNIYAREGYLPDARSGDCNGRTQGGSNADVVIADAFVKGLGATVDTATVLHGFTREDATVVHGSSRKDATGLHGFTREDATVVHGFTREDATGLHGSSREEATVVHGSLREDATVLHGFSREDNATVLHGSTRNTIDYELALEAMMKDGEQDPGADHEKHGRGGLNEYRRLGFVPYGIARAGTRTVEYAYNDYCIAQVARGLGHSDIYEEYMQRSGNWRNLWRSDYEWDDVQGYILPRDANGQWLDSVPWGHSRVFHPTIPYTPVTKVAPWYLPWWDTFFYEALSAEYSLSIPHDVPGLIEACGGAEAFRRRLDLFFERGRYNVGNEPSFLTPCLYHWIGRPDLSTQRIHQIVSDNYSDDPDGLPGNDDSGAMSSWLAFHMLGIYPNAGQDYYLLNTPMVSEYTFHLSNGKVLHAKRQIGRRFAVFFNGRELADARITHEELMQGGELLFFASNLQSVNKSQTPPPALPLDGRGVVTQGNTLDGRGAAAHNSLYTYQVSFTLNRQFRTWPLSFSWQGDTLEVVCKQTTYRIARSETEHAWGFCWLNPQIDGTVYHNVQGTFLFVSADAMRSLSEQGFFLYDNITWRTTANGWVRADIDGTEMLIEYDAVTGLHLVKEMRHNPLGIDWQLRP